MSLSITITLYLWWLVMYLALGIISSIPLAYMFWRQLNTNYRLPFAQHLAKHWFKHPTYPPLMVLLWPLAIWELIRS